MYLYRIVNSVSESLYVGITRSSLMQRWSAHKNCAKSGVKTPLYDSMRSKGIDKFSIELVNTFTTTQELERAEYELIKNLRESGVKVYNILDGGTSYFPIKDVADWKRKLRTKRVGRTPALGMEHTEENKKLFSQVSKDYWATQDTYSVDDIEGLSFIQASKTLGISKTHYYRLRKRTSKN